MQRKVLLDFSKKKKKNTKCKNEPRENCSIFNNFKLHFEVRNNLRAKRN